MRLVLPKSLNWLDQLQIVQNQLPLPLFDEVVIEFLNEFSKAILKNKSMREYPELMATAYWLRKSHLEQLKNDYIDQIGDRIVLPRGTVLHFAPSNVDSIFIYSWVISMLVGNKNIIRLSQNNSEQINILIQYFEQLLSQSKYESIKKSILIISYEHNDQYTKLLSDVCDIRIIWGGDNTIQKIRSIPIPPMSTEIVFADRFSCVMLNSETVLKCTQDEFKLLIQNFYNDAYWFDQMACSSPKLVLWIGDEQTVGKAKDRFWNGLKEIIKQKRYTLSESVSMNKLATSFYFSSKSETSAVYAFDSHVLHRVELKNADELDREAHCGAGLFLELSLFTLTEAKSIFTKKDQTLSYYGFDKDELIQLIKMTNGRGIDRIIPVGKALEFQEIWDGYNLPLYLTREVSVL
ncbi:acyl-CoA reductase [Bacillus salitolerans]|uniref:Acyl-CoA reductase n=1 Tax=Bacillus salitolerans TaxID=1437434 RepID=A0ABW4LRQ3_9BACI